VKDRERERERERERRGCGGERSTYVGKEQRMLKVFVCFAMFNN
jgi:hypothetical protein